jgi:hypothetical protein
MEDSIESYVGEQLKERRQELAQAVYEAQARLADFDAAWSEGDFEWLADEGFLRRFTVNVLRAERAA